MRHFELTQDHIKLLAAANIDIDATSPRLDAKRPFGNSDIYDDIAQIIGVTPVETDGGNMWPVGTIARCERLYHELNTALQVVLTNQTFTPGHFAMNDQYQWKPLPQGKKQ